MPLSAIDAITPAMNHTQRQLLQPFRFGQWTRLAFVGLLAGEGASFTSCNYSGPSTQQGGHQSTHFVAADWWGQFAQHKPMLVTLIVLFALIAIILMLLFAYISSVMRFVLFDSVVRKECHVRKGWRERKAIGWRLFLWELGFSLVAFSVLAIVLGIPALFAWAAGWFNDPSAHLARLILFIVAMVMLFLLILCAVAIVNVATKDFVVPQMAIEGIGATEGWRRLLVKVRGEKGGYAGYIGMKILLTIAAAIAFGIVTLIVMVIMLVPIIGGGAIGVLAGKAAGWTWNVYTISLAVILGTIAFAAILFVVVMISVPKFVFFPAYSIYFFAPRFPPLVDLLWPVPPSTPNNSPPPEPPPTPPMPEPA